MKDAAVTAATRAALLRKYRLLARWRRAKDGPEDGGAADQAALRALAAEFPGALRELDLLGLAEIERRVATLVVPPTSAVETEPWLSWIVAYHALMREALTMKRQPELRSPSVDDAFADDAFARDVERPPEGRLSLVVLRAVARRFDVDPRAVADALFPPRRPRDAP